MTTSYPKALLAPIQSTLPAKPGPGSGGGRGGAAPVANIRCRNDNNLTAITIYQEMIAQRWILATFRRDAFISIEHKSNQYEN